MTRIAPPAVNCEGKVRFDAPDLARAAAHRQSHNKGARSAPYRCPHCRGWHVGARLGRRVQDRRPRAQEVEE